MDEVHVLVLVVIGCAIWVGWRLLSFPGGWGFAFGSEHAGEREHLVAAREKWREANATSYRRVTEAEKRERRERALHDERIRRAEQNLREVSQPGRGALVEERSEMSLHQHVLLITEEEIPLAGLLVRFEQAQHSSHIYTTRPSGAVRLTTFPQPDHEADAVRRFAVRIENTVAEENVFCAQQTTLVAQAEKALREAQADTRARDAARRHVAQTTALHEHDPRRKTARAELDAARKRWQALTGRMPH